MPRPSRLNAQRNAQKLVQSCPLRRAQEVLASVPRELPHTLCRNVKRVREDTPLTASLVAVEPEAAAGVTTLDRAADHLRAEHLAHRPMASGTDPLARPGRLWFAQELVDLAVADPIELARIKPRAEADRTGVEGHRARRPCPPRRGAGAKSRPPARRCARARSSAARRPGIGPIRAPRAARTGAPRAMTTPRVLSP